LARDLPVVDVDFLNYLKTDDPVLTSAVRNFQVGDLLRARDDLGKLGPGQGDPYAALIAARIRRLLNPPDNAQPVCLIWQVSPKSFEGDWLRYILQGYYDTEIIDLCRKEVSRHMIVIDNRFDASREAYYRNAFLSDCTILLIHLSDERFKDDLSAYRWCHTVYRNYWSPLISGLKSVNFFLLGYKTGFTEQEVVPAASRPYLFGFAGDPNKSTRPEMVSALSGIMGGKVHLTSGWNASDVLEVTSYQNILRNCIFAPCPIGNINVDSFRVCEALECGAIPIVERRPGFDYFKNLLGDYPFPVIDKWEDADRVMTAITRADGGASLQARCYAWWVDYKQGLRARLGADCALAFRRADKQPPGL
jgi:hypothetical protein